MCQLRSDDSMYYQTIGLQMRAPNDVLLSCTCITVLFSSVNKPYALLSDVAYYNP